MTTRHNLKKSLQHQYSYGNKVDCDDVVPNRQFLSSRNTSNNSNFSGCHDAAIKTRRLSPYQHRTSHNNQLQNMMDLRRIHTEMPSQLHHYAFSGFEADLDLKKQFEQDLQQMDYELNSKNNSAMNLNILDENNNFIPPVGSKISNFTKSKSKDSNKSNSDKNSNSNLNLLERRSKSNQSQLSNTSLPLTPDNLDLDFPTSSFESTLPLDDSTVDQMINNVPKPKLTAKQSLSRMKINSSQIPPANKFKQTVHRSSSLFPDKPKLKPIVSNEPISIDDNMRADSGNG